MTTLSPAQIAKRLGVSRSTVSRMLSNGEIKGYRNNKGHWRVDEEHLPTPRKENKTVQDTVQNTVQTSVQDQVKIARLEEQNKALEERVGELTRERDLWKQEADDSKALSMELAKKRWRWPWS